LAEKDVVLAMDRPWIEAGLKHAAVTGYDLPALLVQRVARLRGTQRIDGTFLKYVVASKAFTEYVLSIQTGTAVPHISGGQIKDFRFLMPPLSAQKAIVHVLESVDGKIELNRRMVTNLEESGRALFNSWFIEFDPVKEKVYGREPFGLEFKVAELFPAGFADAELGKVPSSWSVTTLAGIVTERTSKVGGDNGHVVLSAVASGELKRSAEHFTKQVHSQDTSKYKRVEQWDYAYNPSRINIGSIGMLEEPIVGAVSPVYTVLRPAQGYEWFLRFFLDLPQTKEVINQFCSGSVRQSLSFKDFAAIPVVLPPKEIAEAFARRWQELNALRQQLEVESAKLAEVRDTLLPKLMSGEPRVPDELMA
jgi:type I restriction enzyme S subunit